MLKAYEDIALSDSQLMHLIDNKANLILYPELVNYDNIDEVLGPHKACVLLFEAKPGYGHWTCLFRSTTSGRDLIEFFNPYGGFPDDSLKFISSSFRKQSNQDIPYLSVLLLESPYQLSYNEHDFQKHANNIRTCGRHCAVRLIYRDLSLEEYDDLIKAMCKKMSMSPDEIVSLITSMPSQLSSGGK